MRFRLAAAMLIAWATQAHAGDAVRVGLQTFVIGGGAGFIVGSNKPLWCDFAGVGGWWERLRYVGLPGGPPHLAAQGIVYGPFDAWGKTVLQLKSTPLAPTITVMDLFGVTNMIRQVSYRIYEPLLMVAAISIILTFIITRAFRIGEAQIPQRR
jgi:hypothetical protein